MVGKFRNEGKNAQTRLANRQRQFKATPLCSSTLLRGTTKVTPYFPLPS